MTLKVRPSLLPEIYWSHSLNDLRTLTRLFIQHDMVRTLSFTESLATVAGRLFGQADSESDSGDYNTLETEADLMDFARMVNSGG